jgi:hypothetical protein
VWISWTSGCILLFTVLRGENVVLGETPNGSEHTAALVESETWALVQRVVSSRQLLKAPQLRDILLYISRRGLTDNATAISELEIGCNVLGRGRDFSPNDDNIVRVQVRHLRRKLEEYFSSDGADEPLVLTIPKGGYVPRIEERTFRAQATMSLSAPTLPVDAERARAAITRARYRWWAFSVLAVFLAALVAGMLLLRRQPASLRRMSDADENQEHRAGPLWSSLFTPGRETDIVVADSSLVSVQDILNADIPLSEYLSGAYPEKLIETVPDKRLQAALRLIAGRQYTSLADADIVSKLTELSRHYTAQISICYSRFISLREFKTRNVILIGSRRGIPWEQLFESQLNFSLEEDPATKKYFFRNKAPLPGEQPEYRPSAGRDANTYADIAFLPNLAGTGNVLILAGIDMAATEAAGELVASQDFLDLLSKMLRSRGPAPASYIEILMQTKAVAGGAQGKILAYRLLPGKSLVPLANQSRTANPR